MTPDQNSYSITNQSSGSWTHSVLSIWLVVVFAILILLVSAGYDIFRDRNTCIENEQQHLLTQTRAIEVNLDQQTESIRDVLRSIVKGHTSPRIESRLKELSEAIPGVRTLLILDKAGNSVAANRKELVGRNFREREYFSSPLREQLPETMYISPPFRTVLNTFVITLSVIIPDQDGGFNGVVAASLDPDYFSVLLKSVRYAEDMTSSITHGDGIIFMMTPDSIGVAGINRAVPESLFTRHIKSGNQTSIFTGKSIFDDGNRIIAIRTFNPPKLKLNRPLIIAVSRDLDTILVDWREDAILKSSTTVVFSLFLIMGTYLLQQRQRRLDQNTQLLLDEQLISRNEIFKSQELQKINFRLELLQEVSQYRATTVQELLDFSLEKVIALTESSIGYIYHYSEEGKQFVLNTWSRDVMAACSVTEPQSIYHLDKTGIWGEVVRQRRAIMVNDYEIPNELKKGYPEGHVPLTRFLSVPVFDKERIVAVVGVANKVHPYDQTDQLQLTLMMDGVWKIASRLGMEEQIMRAGHEWQMTFDFITDCISLVDADQKIIRCNQATSHFLDRDVADIIGQPCCSLFHDDDYVDCPMLRSNISHRSETATIKHRDRWIEITVDPIISDIKVFTGAVLIVRDVTERERLEQELKIQASVITGVIESTDSAIFSIDDSYRYTSFNFSHKKIMKDLYNTDIHLGDLVTSLMTIEDAAIAKANLDKALAGEKFVVEADSGDSTLVRSVFEISHNPIRNSKGVVEGVAVFARDIHVERESEESMRDMQAQLMQSDKMATIGQLAAGVAHEINNPIGFVSSNMVTLGKYIEKYNSYISQLEDGVRNPVDESLPAQFIDARKMMKLDYVMKDIHVLLEESNEGIERVKGIVNDLRTFSRADALEIGPADLNGCIDSTINIVFNEIKYFAVINRHYGDLPKVSCNIQQVSQVIMNLLINATHAIQAKGEEVGEITITSWSDDLNAFVSISDNGCGIPADRLGKIFDAFYTTKDVGKGTGLGLSISSGIILKHGGGIRIASEVGIGSTFTVRLPIRPQSGATGTEQ